MEGGGRQWNGGVVGLGWPPLVIFRVALDFRAGRKSLTFGGTLGPWKLSPYSLTGVSEASGAGRPLVDDAL